MGHCEDIVAKTPTDKKLEYDCFSCSGDKLDCIAYTKYNGTCSKYVIAQKDLTYYKAGRLDMIRFYSMLKRHFGIRDMMSGEEKYININGF